MKFPVSCALLFLSGSLFASSVALAQDASASPASDAPADIIVTAQNRSQKVQDVPIAISVVSGEALAAAGVSSVASVEKVSPALQITSDTTNTRVSVRGVGTLSNGEAQDQSIAVNIDGEYINRPTILNAAIFDIDRVEVLRGPQGTLYGRNSTGGAVNFLTRKPGKEFGVNASATYGNFDQVTLDGGIDVPLGDIGGVRVSGIYTEHDGYNRHPNTPVTYARYASDGRRRSGSDQTYGGRLSLRLKPVDGLTIDGALERIEQNLVPAVQAGVDLNQAANAPGAGCALNGFIEVGPTTPGTQCVPQNTRFLQKIDRHNYNSPQTGVGFFDLRSTAVRGRVAYDFGAATLTYTGGYRTTKNTGNNPLSPNYVFGNFGASVKTHSHELRLNGVTNDIQWQTGIFYFNEKQNTNTGLYSPLAAGGAFINYFRHPVDSDSYSAFGQVEVPLGETFTAVGGLRYTKDKRSAVYSNYGFTPGAFTPPTGAPAQVLNLSYKGSKVSYMAGLNYKPNSDTLVYAKIATGYKSGGFDSVTTFRPESNTAYESGLKLNFGPGSRNLFNVSAYYYDYKDLQNEVLLDAAVGAQTFNAGKATIWGVEAETEINLSRLDKFTASFNYLSAKYDQFSASYSVIDLTNTGNTRLNVADNPNLSGNRLPQTPKFVIGVGYDHKFDLGAAGVITAGVYSRLKSDYYLTFFNYADTRQESFTQTDLNLEYKPDNKAFSVQLYVRNLENIRQLTYAGYTAAGPDDVINWQFGTPRTYGLRASVDF